jgi:hypothetical protein
VAEIEAAVAEALASLEALRRREMIPQLILRAVRTELASRPNTDPTRRSLTRPLPS